MTYLRGHLNGQGRSYEDFMNRSLIGTQRFYGFFHVTPGVADVLVTALRLRELHTDVHGMFTLPSRHYVGAMLVCWCRVVTRMK